MRKFLDNEGITKTTAIGIVIIVVVAAALGAWIALKPPKAPTAVQDRGGF